MSASKNMQSPETIALYDKLIATHPEIERKGSANPYTSLNGNMFTMLSPSGVMALRLPEDEREAFLKKHKAKLFEAYGAVMKEYVAVPESLLHNTQGDDEVSFRELRLCEDAEAEGYDEDEEEALMARRGRYLSLCTVSMEKAGRQTAIYSAPPSSGVE